MDEAVDTCALWYERWNQISYDLFDSEQDAAGFAVYLSNEGQGVPLGVQFADGRAVKIDEWAAFSDRQRQWEQSEHGGAGCVMEPRPTRPVRDPFTDAVVDIDAGEPRWLGRHVHTTS
jgi:hypothetical protein